jgi:hypothetical protein
MRSKNPYPFFPNTRIKTALKIQCLLPTAADANDFMHTLLLLVNAVGFRQGSSLEYRPGTTTNRLNAATNGGQLLTRLLAEV